MLFFLFVVIFFFNISLYFKILFVQKRGWVVKIKIFLANFDSSENFFIFLKLLSCLLSVRMIRLQVPHCTSLLNGLIWKHFAFLNSFSIFQNFIIYIYIYLYICVCVCLRVYMYMFFKYKLYIHWWSKL